MYCVYRHIRLDTNAIFYVGIGSIKRAYDKISRNSHWKNIVNKCGYDVQITHEDVCWEEACVIEKYLIEFYGRKDLGKGELVNMTDGGDGITGYRHDYISRAKMSSKKKSLFSNKKNHPLYGKFGKENPNFGKRRTDYTKDKIKQTKLNINNPMYGKTGSLCPNSIKVIDTSNGTVYSSIKEAAIAIGINPSVLRGMLCGCKKNKTTIQYLTKNKHDEKNRIVQSAI